MTRTLLQVGAGGFGARWCREFLPPNVADGTVRVVGLVDIDAEALRKSQQALGLADALCFTDLETAFTTVKADFCTIVVPPAFHERVVDLAIAKGMHILSEKPIADTLEGCVRIADKVKRAGLKMAVTMSHRFDRDKQTLAYIVGSGHLGPLSSLYCFSSQDFRKFGTWRRFRHEMQHPLLIENAIHQLDILATLAGAPCRSVYANGWRPEWAEFAGNSDAVVVFEFENGVRSTYVGSVSSAVGLAHMPGEEYRADGRDGIASLRQREIEVFRRIELPPGQRNVARPGKGMEVPLLAGAKWAHSLLIERFVAWLDGGAALETEVEANLTSNALIFAAIESSRTGAVVNFRQFLKRQALA